MKSLSRGIRQTNCDDHRTEYQKYDREERQRIVHERRPELIGTVARQVDAESGGRHQRG